METVLITILIVLALLLAGLLVFLLLGQAGTRRTLTGQDSSIELLGRQLEALRANQETFGQSVSQNLQTGQKNLTDFLTHSGQTLGQVREQIGKLQADSQQMLQISADLRTLQNILQAPKLRGQLGESSLENLLKTILPADHYSLQHSFRTGKKVDALIRLAQHSVCVDAKFPLETFTKMTAAADEDEKNKLRRIFQKDVQNHIDKIAESYILPDEGTLDFALMYIPAENVYYETVVKYAADRMDLAEYALAKKVIPVSPNLLYVYLMTVVMGLHGLQIEKRAAEIQTQLKKTAADFNTFLDTWQTLGTHLRNAQNQYDAGQSKLNKFTLQIDQLH